MAPPGTLPSPWPVGGDPRSGPGRRLFITLRAMTLQKDSQQVRLARDLIASPGSRRPLWRPRHPSVALADWWRATPAAGPALDDRWRAAALRNPQHQGEALDVVAKLMWPGSPAPRLRNGDIVGPDKTPKLPSSRVASLTHPGADTHARRRFPPRAPAPPQKSHAGSPFHRQPNRGRCFGSYELWRR